MAAITRSAQSAGVTVVAVTGHADTVRPALSGWLARHRDILGGDLDLLTRPDGDARDPALSQCAAIGHARARFNVLRVVHDDSAVLRWCVEEGLAVTRVRLPADLNSTFHVPNPFADMAVPGLVSTLPEGRYAVPTDEGHLGFYRIKRPRSGRWAGRTFLNVLASDSEHPVGGASAVAILGKIEADPAAAMARFGREVGVCGRCGRTLTDDESRAAGLGPTCRTR